MNGVATIEASMDKKALRGAADDQIKLHFFGWGRDGAGRGVNFFIFTYIMSFCELFYNFLKLSTWEVWESL